MSENTNIVRLIDRAPGIPSDGHGGLIEWLESWVKALGSGAYGDMTSLVLVIENADGSLAMISQSSRNDFDHVRMSGLLTIAAHRRMDGGAKIEDLM